MLEFIAALFALSFCGLVLIFHLLGRDRYDKEPYRAHDYVD